MLNNLKLVRDKHILSKIARIKVKRPLLAFCISLIAGIAVSSISNSYIIIVAAIILLAIVTTISIVKNPQMIFFLIGITLFFSIGAIQYKYLNDYNTGKMIKYSDQQVTIKGIVNSEPNVGETKTSYILQTEQITTNGIQKSLTAKVILNTLNSNSRYDYGEEIIVTGTLTIPKGRRNPGGFDYRNYLAQSGVSATVFALKEDIKDNLLNKANIFVKTGLMLREKIVNVIKRSMPSEQAALLNGMLIGYREDLSDEVQKAFSDSGLTHIMAVSGANVAFIVFPLIFLFRKVIKLKLKTSNIIVIGVLVIFTYITGFQPSVLRAVIMATVVLVGQMLMRETDIYTTISFSAILLLLYNPSTLFNIGFQLSFVATLSIVLLCKNIKRVISFKYLPNIITDVISITLAAQIGVLPIIILYFNNVSLISIVSNVLVIPIVGIITVLGSIMAIVGNINIFFSQVIGLLNSPFLTFVLYVTKTVSAIPYAVLKVTTPSMLMVLIYYCVVLFFMWYKPLKKIKIKPIYYITGLSVLLIVIGLTYLTPKKLETVFIDVGEGDSVFLRTYSGKTVLIDGGGFNARLNPGKSIGDSVIIPFLLDYGVSNLDMIIATHGHDDHIQGLEAVLKGFPVKELLIPDIADKTAFGKLISVCADKKIKIDVCQEGDIIRIDNQTFFDVLFPNKNWESSDTLNNCSLVLKLQYINNSILFTGDIQAEIEDYLLKEGEDLQADVLKVAHHGSTYSTTPDFLKAVNPTIAIISVGKNNFGHPAPLTLERLNMNNTKVYRTDECGALVLTSDGQKITIDKTISN